MEVSVPTCRPRLSVVEDWGVLGGLGTHGRAGQIEASRQTRRDQFVWCRSRAGWPPTDSIATPPVWMAYH